MNASLSRPLRCRRAAPQRGVVLLFSLIALVVMLLVATALVRSFNSSLFSAGNIGFKRDLQNQSERAVAAALAEFRTGGKLADAGLRSDARAEANYSPTMLPTNAQGIPNDLALSDTAFAARYKAADLESSDRSVKLRYVIDRLCASVGDETTLSSGNCRLVDNPVPAGTSESNLMGADRSIAGKAGAVPQGVVYRLSVRASGPRKTQSFFQSTFTVPSS